MAITITITDGVMKLDGLYANPIFVTASNGNFYKDVNSTYKIYDKVYGMEYNIGDYTNVTGMVSDAALEGLLKSFFSKSPFVNKYGLIFNGTDEYLIFDDINNFDYTDEFSISFWIKTASVKTTGSFISKQLATVSLRGYRIVFKGAETDKLRFQMINASGSNELIYSFAVGNINDNARHHIVITNDGAKDVKCYVDGNEKVRTLIGSDTLSATIIDPNAAFVYGARKSIIGVANDFMDSIIDEVSLYDIELSELRVQEIYNNGNLQNIERLPSFINCTFWTRNGDDIRDTAPYIRDQVYENDGIMNNMDNVNFVRI